MSTELQNQAVEEIKNLCLNMQDGLEVCLEYAKDVGKILCERQEAMKCDRGAFGKWVADNFEFSRQTAWNWMNLHMQRNQVKNAESLAKAQRLIAPAEDPPKKTNDSKDKTESPAEDTPEEPDDPEDEPEDEPENNTTEPLGKSTKPTTSAGEDIPDDLIEIFERINELRTPINKMNAILYDIRKAVAIGEEGEPGDELYAFLTFTAFESAMKNATRLLRFSIPYAICGYCGGDSGTQNECDACKGLGWINEPTHKAMPKEMK